MFEGGVCSLQVLADGNRANTLTVSRPARVAGVEPLVEDVERVVLDVQDHPTGVAVRSRMVHLADVGDREVQLGLASRTVCRDAEVTGGDLHFLIPLLLLNCEPHYIIFEAKSQILQA